jgi:hypothetical protein
MEQRALATTCSKRRVRVVDYAASCLLPLTSDLLASDFQLLVLRTFLLSSFPDSFLSSWLPGFQIQIRNQKPEQES